MKLVSAVFVFTSLLIGAVSFASESDHLLLRLGNLATSPMLTTKANALETLDLNLEAIRVSEIQVLDGSTTFDVVFRQGRNGDGPTCTIIASVGSLTENTKIQIRPESTNCLELIQQ